MTREYAESYAEVLVARAVIVGDMLREDCGMPPLTRREEWVSRRVQKHARKRIVASLMARGARERDGREAIRV